ncbi:reverse transcriptase [Lasius niger]|uniref:Reverse transcriptase n=1 Tax=Lasius niger TaxID=67767 RepID=A0A0J7N6Y7_LASNI|nr:reverse transcriptase [Lasius niger]
MALGRLLPNLGGPSKVVRRLYAGTVHAMLMYGAPVWAEKVVATRKLKDALRQLQRRVANRICRGYRTVSWTAMGVLSGVPPVELLARMYTEVYNCGKELERAGVQLTEHGVSSGGRPNASSSIDGWAYWMIPVCPAGRPLRP